MKKTLSIPGRSPTGTAFESVRSPYSGEVVAEVQQADLDDLDAALELQSGWFRDRARRLPAHQRVDILKKAASIVLDEADDLAMTIAKEGGKPLTDAVVEVKRAANGVDYLAGEISRHAGHEIPMGSTAATAGRLAFTTHEPIGVVAAVSAFNHPLNLIVHQAGPAVAAGCPVIVKPAPQTPLSCFAFVDILRRAGLPAEWCIALPCENDVAERLVTSRRIAYFSFIGSARVGWMLRSKLAPGVRCALEHGGAAPVIVDESADLDAVLPPLLKGGFYHAGQVCVSVQRVFVHESRKAELAERLASGASKLVTGDPTLAETEVGPLIRAGEVTRVGEWVAEAKAAGARVACGGEALDHQCYAPTVLIDTPDDARAMSLEIFGPVVNVVGYSQLAEAIARANAVPWAFQAAIFTSDLGRALDAIDALDATAVMVNDHTAFRADWMPFGGRKQSGLGLGGMPYSMHELTQPKMVVLRS